MAHGPPAFPLSYTKHIMVSCKKREKIITFLPLTTVFFFFFIEMGCTNSTEKRPKDKRRKSNAPEDYPDHLSPPEIKITETDSDRRSIASSSSSNSHKSSKSKKGENKYRKNSHEEKDDTIDAQESEDLPIVCVKRPEPKLIACDFNPTVEEVKTADDQDDVTAHETEAKTSDDNPPETEKSSPEEAPESDHEENQTTEAPE